MLSADRPITPIRLHPSPQIKYHIRTTRNIFDEICKTPPIPQTILESGIQCIMRYPP
jgi:hypothetical protein